MTDASPTQGVREPPEQLPSRRREPVTTQRQSPVVRAGTYAWAAIGLALAVALLGVVAAQVRLVLVPLALALFPATLLYPVSKWLARRMPAAAAALLTVVGSFALLAGVIAALVPVIAAELPRLLEVVSDGLRELDALLRDGPFGLNVGGIEGGIERIGELLTNDGTGITGMLSAAATAVEVVVGTVLLIVVLFFYLKDGDGLARGIGAVLPAGMRGHFLEIGGRIWDTLGRFFRGQLLIALVDAVFIGLGLLVLGVPLVIPLAVLVFLGGLFPIVGAVASGGVAVLVGLADGGLGLGVAVLVLVLIVQQVETNVLEPYVLGQAVALHPLVVLIAITAGAVTVGILGAFLAVPVAAAIQRVFRYVQEQRVRDGSQPERAA